MYVVHRAERKEGRALVFMAGVVVVFGQRGLVRREGGREVRWQIREQTSSTHALLNTVLNADSISIDGASQELCEVSKVLRMMKARERAQRICKLLPSPPIPVSKTKI